MFVCLFYYFHNQSQETQAKVQPKKKFGFKSSKNRQKPVEKELEGLNIKEKQEEKKEEKHESSKSYKVADQSDQTLLIEGGEVAGCDLSLAGLVRCRVEVIVLIHYQHSSFYSHPPQPSHQFNTQYILDSYTFCPI